MKPNLMLIYVLVISLVACTPSRDQRSDSVVNSENHIIGGIDLSGGQVSSAGGVDAVEEYDERIISPNSDVMGSVVKIDIGGADDAYCTGVMIGPKTFLTAGHCVSEKSNSIYEKGGRLVDIGLVGYVNKYSLRAEIRNSGNNSHIRSTIWRHPRWSEDTEKDKPYFRYDIAIGVISEKSEPNFKAFDAKDKDKFQPEPAHPYDEPFIYAPLCSPAVAENLVGKRLVFLGYGCMKLNRRTRTIQIAGGKVSDHPKNIIENFAVNGGVSCPGDSGGPYMLVDEQTHETCVLGVNYLSNRKDKSWGISVIDPEIRNWIQDFAEKNKLEICGLNKECTKPIVPTTMKRTNAEDLPLWKLLFPEN